MKKQQSVTASLSSSRLCKATLGSNYQHFFTIGLCQFRLQHLPWNKITHKHQTSETNIKVYCYIPIFYWHLVLILLTSTMTTEIKSHTSIRSKYKSILPHTYSSLAPCAYSNPYYDHNHHVTFFSPDHTHYVQCTGFIHLLNTVFWIVTAAIAVVISVTG